MTKLDLFEKRIDESMKAAANERIRRLDDLAKQMDRSVHSIQRFEEVADAIHHLEIRPRLDALKRNFPNATLEHWVAENGLVSHLLCVPTAQYPANVKMTISVELDPAQQRSSLRYKLSIIPQLMSFDHDAELAVDLHSPDMEAITTWIEQTLESFLATYLRLESEPTYQRDNQHVDPVCGMHVQAGVVAHQLLHSHHVYHFCSEDCRERFAHNPDFFLGRAPTRMKVC